VALVTRGDVTAVVAAEMVGGALNIG